MTDAQALSWAVAALAALIVLVLLRRMVKALGIFLLRAVVGGGVLAALEPFAPALGLHLGVNLFNLTLLGLLGAPGFGLLLLLNWLLW